MKKILLGIVALGLFAFVGCDQIDNPYIPVVQIDLDTNFYTGNWSDYEANEWPIFVANPNTNRNILLEDYTGHKCPNCPPAGVVAEDLHNANPDRVFVAAIHAGPVPTGISGFQETDATFTTDFTTPETQIYGGFFMDYGFFANPQGTINRFPYGTNNDGSEMFQLAGTWTTRVNDMLTENDLKVDIQAISNFYDVNNGGYIHTEVEFKQAVTGNFKIVASVIEDLRIDKQKMPDGSTNNSYEHKHLFIGTVDGQAWGQNVASGSIDAGLKVNIDYSYGIPNGLTKDDIHFLIYVYNDDTKEIMQVIKHEF